MPFADRFTVYRARAADLWACPGVKTGAKWAERLFTFGLMGLLVVQLIDMGWREVLAAAPTTPWFYLLFAANYMVLPLSEALIFGRLWRRPRKGLVGVGITRRIVNRQMFSYAGELYLYLWARKNIGVSEPVVRHAVKDNAIVSGLMSTIVAVSVCGVFVAMGYVELPNAISSRSWLIPAGIVGLAIVLVVLYRLRGKLTRLSAGDTAYLGIVHAARFLIVYTLQVAIWAVVAPEVELRVWLTLLVMLIVVQRIPLLPSMDLVFMNASVAVSRSMDGAGEAVFAVIAISTLIDRVLNVVLFSILNARGGLIGQLSAQRPSEPGIGEELSASNPQSDPRHSGNDV